MNRNPEAEKIFEGDRFAMETTGIKIDEASEGFASCTLLYDGRHMNAAGSVMGGAIFTLADFAFGVAANISGRKTVSLSSQINFLNPPSGGSMTAVARCVRSGGRTCFYDIQVSDATGKCVAAVSTVGYIIQDNDSRKQNV